MSNQELRLLIKNELEYLKFNKPKSPYNHRNIYKKYKRIIDEHTIFLSKNSSFQEKLYCYINNIASMRLCPECNKRIKFIGTTMGYNKYCCASCFGKNNSIIIERKRFSKLNFSFSGNISDDIKILSSLNTNGLNFYKYIYMHYKKEIEAKINHVKENNYHEKVYCYINNIFFTMLCPECSNELKFNDFRSGYNKYCCQKCSNINRIERIKKSYKEKTGYDYPSQNPAVKQKKKETNMMRRGVEHPMQDPKILEKAQNTSFRTKDYIMPSGDVRRIQGYENHALDILLKTYDEEDIETSVVNIPKIEYYFEDTMHRSYPDIFILSENRFIEVKCDYTFNIEKDKNLAKQQASKNYGYKHDIWIIKQINKYEGKIVEIL